MLHQGATGTAADAHGHVLRAALILLASAALALGGEAAAPPAQADPAAADPAAAGQVDVSASTAALIANVTHPTAVHLPGGPTTLAGAVARLSASGNVTVLAGDLNPAATADLPAVDGTYWQALLAVCTAFDLGLGGVPATSAERSGNDVQESAGRLRLVMPVQRGAVELIKRADGKPRLWAEAHGPLAIVIEDVAVHQTRTRARGESSARWANIAVRLVLEPHINEVSIGSAIAELEARSSVGGQPLVLQAEPLMPDDITSGVTRLLLPQFPTLSTLQLAGSLTLEIAEATTLNATVRPGATVVLNHEGVQVTLHLIDSDTAKRESRRGPGLICSYAADIVTAEPVLRISAAGQDIPVSNSYTERRDLDNEEIILFAQDPLPQEYAVAADFAFRRGSAELPLECSIDLNNLPAGDAGLERGAQLQRPTAVSWPAGRLNLQTVLQQLRQGGNQVLLELGVDESRALELPAFSGSFWEGLLTLCRAYHLTILASTSAAEASSDTHEDGSDGSGLVAVPIDGGAVCLGSNRADRPAIDCMQACGPLLSVLSGSNAVVTRGRLGVERTANIACRLRMEPRLSSLHVRESGVLWHAFADVDGRNLPVCRPVVSHREPRSREAGLFGLQLLESAPVADVEPWVVAVSGLAGGASHVRLGGLFVGQLEQPVEATVTLAAGQRHGVRLGQRSLVVMFLDASEAQAQGLGEAAICVSGGDGLSADLNLELRTMSGERVQAHGHDTRTRQGLEYVWMFQGLKAGSYQVALSTDEPLIRVTLPFTLAADLP